MEAAGEAGCQTLEKWPEKPAFDASGHRSCGVRQHAILENVSRQFVLLRGACVPQDLPVREMIITFSLIYFCFRR